MNLPRNARVAVAGYYPPPFGGESVHVLELATRLRGVGLLRQIVNLRRGAPPSPAYVDGAGSIALSRRLASLLGPETLLHLHSNGHSWRSWRVIAAAAWQLRRRRAPSVLTLHSGLSPAFLGRRGPAGRRVLGASLEAFARVVCVNEAIQAEVMRLGVSPDRTAVIPAFLERAAGALDEHDERLLSAFRPRICVVAGDGPEYGIEVMLRALARLTLGYPNVGCFVIGIGETETARELGLSGRVRFLGPVAHDRCLALMARADVFARPTLADGDAVSIREALALGTPVVASRTSFRPPGTTTFPIGDDCALAHAIENVLQIGRRPPAAERTEDFFEALLSVYAGAIEEHA